MKKKFSTLIFIGLILMGSAFNDVVAQKMEGDFVFGIGLVVELLGDYTVDGVTYSPFQDQFLSGLQVDTYYSINSNFTIGGAFTYYIPIDIKGGGFNQYFSENYNFRQKQLNINALFYTNFWQDKISTDVSVYYLVGIRINRVLFEATNTENGTVRFNDDVPPESGIRIDLGAGWEYPLNIADLYAEVFWSHPIYPYPGSVDNMIGASTFKGGVGLRFWIR